MAIAVVKYASGNLYVDYDCPEENPKMICFSKPSVHLLIVKGRTQAAAEKLVNGKACPCLRCNVVRAQRRRGKR